MALRMRTITANGVGTQENNVAKVVGKTKTSELPRRAALGEIGNVNLKKSESNNDTTEKKELKKPVPIKKQNTLVPPRQTTSRFIHQAPTKPVVCKTTTLSKPSKVVIKNPTQAQTANIQSRLPKISSRPALGGKSAYALANISKLTTSTVQKKVLNVPKVPQNAGFRDIDKEAASNPILLGEYAPDIYAYLRSMEGKFTIKKEFLNGKLITPKMRGIVVDWLVDVQIQYAIMNETLHLCVGILDRYLQASNDVTRQKLQLVGVTAMWIACKYEELLPPEIENFAYITDNTYSKKEILEMEKLIHKKLNFSYGQPLSLSFLRRYTSASKAEVKHHTYGKYFLELGLLTYELRHVKQSLIAASAIFIAFCIENKEEKPFEEIWSESLCFYSTYSFNDIKPHVSVLAQTIIKTKSSKLQSLQRKYCDVSTLKVSTVVHSKTEILQKLAELE